MIRATVLILSVLLVGAAPVAAQSHVGVRAGASGDPGQFFFGGHIESQPLAESVTFRPNVEVGVGHDVTVAAINLEFAWWLPAQARPWRVYLGGGPAAVIRSHHDGRGRGDGNVGGGFNLLLGAQHRDGLFGEFKVGLIDSPEVKVTIGYAFR